MAVIKHDADICISQPIIFLAEIEINAYFARYQSVIHQLISYTFM